MIDAVHFDITQLLLELHRTGIQRVERELARNWPDHARLIPVRYDGASDSFEVLPDKVFELLCEEPHEDRAAGGEADRLAPYLRQADRLDISRRALMLFECELFFDPDRAFFVQAMARSGEHQVAMLTHDFLPWLQPHFFVRGAGTRLMPYLCTLRAASRLAFVSEHTRLDWRVRVSRRSGRDGPVFPLGGDGLKIERQGFSAERRGYLVLGTIEPRKNTIAALEAFERLWREGAGPTLYLLGRLDEGWKAAVDAIRRGEEAGWLRYLPVATDEDVRCILRRVRATIFPSEHEGFGLPPIESLAAGVPVILHADLPSTSALPPLGQVRLPRCDAAAIAEAVGLLETEAGAARLWRKTAGITIPSWRDFARDVADWIQFGR